MICYILGLLGMFCLFITYVSAMNLGYIKGEFLTTFLLLFVFISFFGKLKKQSEKRLKENLYYF